MNMRTAKLEYILAVIIYGTIGGVLKYINLPSEIVVVCRGLIGSLFVFLFLKVRRVKMDKAAIGKNIKWLILSGASLGLNWVFLFASYNVTTVAIGSLCNYLAPVIVVFLSPLLYKDKLTFKKVACILTAFVGIVFISGVIEGGFENVNLLGIGLGLLSALCFVGIIIFNKKIVDIPVFDKVVIQLFISALAVMPYAILHNIGTTIELDTRSILLTLLLCIVHTGVAYCLYFGSMPLLPVQSISILGYIEPVMCIVISFLFLNEPLTLFGVIGAILILGSAVVSELKA